MRIKKCASIFHPSTKKTTSITTMTKKKKISQLLLILLIDADVTQLKHLHHLLMMEKFVLLPDLHSLSLSGDLEVSQSLMILGRSKKMLSKLIYFMTNINTSSMTTTQLVMIVHGNLETGEMRYGLNVWKKIINFLPLLLRSSSRIN